MDFSQLREAYTDVRRACRNDWRSDAVSQAILDLAVTSLQFLAAECDQIALNSLVPGKNYISFLRNGVVTRPANRALFLLDPERIAKEWHSWMRNRPNIPDAGRIFYTVALAPCLAMELFGRNNKKGPATFFECMIGHFFAKSLDTNPTKNAELSVAGRSVRMTMDFLFEIAGNPPNIHLPVKMSTRERVVKPGRINDCWTQPTGVHGIKESWFCSRKQNLIRVLMKSWKSVSPISGLPIRYTWHRWNAYTISTCRFATGN